jgi:hypothetical protein
MITNRLELSLFLSYFFPPFFLIIWHLLYTLYDIICPMLSCRREDIRKNREEDIIYIGISHDY